MRTRSADYGEAIEHLPEGAILMLQDIAWEEYEQLLEDLSRRPGVRLTYDQGQLAIMTPLRRHEKYKEVVGDLIKALADELGVSMESSGSTTWRRKDVAKGIEPDISFHIAQAQRVIGKDELDSNADPPPDLVVEIDITNESLGKLPIYAAFGVPEIWRYIDRQRSVVMYALGDEAYVEIDASRSFPVLTPEVLARFVNQSRAEGQQAALSAFRRWVRSR